MGQFSEFARALALYFPPRLHAAPDAFDEPGDRNARTHEFTLSQIPAAGSAPLEISETGFAVLLAPASHAGANLEIAFDRFPGSGASSVAGGWNPLTPGSVVRPVGGRPFDRFFVRKRATVPSAIDAESVYLTVDPSTLQGAFDVRPRAAQLSSSGSLSSLLKFLTLAGSEVDGRASDEGAAAVSGWTGSAYVRLLASAAGWLSTRIISGQDGIDAGAGAVSAATPRVTLASDDPAVTALQIMDDWDESNRAAVNVISGQAGIAADGGASSAATPRVTQSSPDTVNQGRVTVAAAASTQIAAAAAARKRILIRNRDSTNSVFIRFGATATSSHFELIAGAAIEMGNGLVVNAIGDGTNAVDVDYVEEVN